MFSFLCLFLDDALRRSFWIGGNNVHKKFHFFPPLVSAMRADHGTFRTSGVIWESATFGPSSSRNMLEGRRGSGGTSAEIREPLCFLAYSLSPPQPTITPFYIL
jgi:hypothetical protein